MLYCKNSFVHSIGFLVGGRFFAFFLYRSGSSLYSMGLPGSLIFLFIYIFAQFTYKKKTTSVASIPGSCPHCEILLAVPCVEFLLNSHVKTLS